MAQGVSFSVACGTFPDQELNPRPLYWQVDSYPLCQQWSPYFSYFWRLRNPRSWHQEIQCLMRACCNLTWQKRQAYFLESLYKGTVLLTIPSHFSKFPFPHIIILVAGISTYEFCRDTNIQIIAVSLIFNRTWILSFIAANAILNLIIVSLCSFLTMASQF